MLGSTHEIGAKACRYGQRCLVGFAKLGHLRDETGHDFRMIGGDVLLLSNISR